MPGRLVVPSLELYDFQETGGINHYSTASEHEAEGPEAGQEHTRTRQGSWQAPEASMGAFAFCSVC